MITASEINLRIKKLRLLMEERGIGALLVTSSKNTAYLTGRDTAGFLWQGVMHFYGRGRYIRTYTMTFIVTGSIPYRFWCPRRMQ